MGPPFRGASSTGYCNSTNSRGTTQANVNKHRREASAVNSNAPSKLYNYDVKSKQNSSQLSLHISSASTIDLSQYDTSIKISAASKRYVYTIDSLQAPVIFIIVIRASEAGLKQSTSILRWDQQCLRPTYL